MRSRVKPAQAVTAVFLLLTIAGWTDAVAAAQLTLTWADNGTDEAGFSVERRTGAGGAYSEVTVTGPGVTSYADQTVSAGSTYCYRVRAFNNVGYSAYTNEACATVSAGSMSLAVVRMGAGSGSVTSAPAGINCGAACSASFAGGTAVALTATPAVGSSFGGWSGGGCSGTGGCTVTLSAPTTVMPTFSELGSYTLTVSDAGSGSGTVTSSPAGIDCGSTCSASYPSATAVTLTAVPATGSTFTGWSGGGCGTANPCTVSLSASIGVQATFAQKPPSSVTLTLKKFGSGRGMVKSPPGGINCGSVCSASYPKGTQVALTAVAATGSYFSGWSGGGCRGIGPCTVSLSAATTVSATFGRCGSRHKCS